MPTAVESQTEKNPLSLIHLPAPAENSRKQQTENFQIDRCGETLCAPAVELMHAL
jgi:hypothetical protein